MRMRKHVLRREVTVHICTCQREVSIQHLIRHTVRLKTPHHIVFGHFDNVVGGVGTQHMVDNLLVRRYTSGRFRTWRVIQLCKFALSGSLDMMVGASEQCSNGRR